MRDWYKSILAALGLGVTALVQAAVFEVQAPVEAVTLYHNQAAIVRSARLEIEESGQHLLRIPTPAVEDIQAVAVSLEGAQLLGQAMTIGDSAEVSKDAALLLDKQRQLKVLQRRINDNVALTDALLVRLEQPTVSVADIGSQLQIFSEDYDALLNQRTTLEQEIVALEATVDWQGATTEALEKVLLLSIQAEKGAQVGVRLVERSHQASWRPLSEWRLDTQNKQLDILGQALIRQQTGLDWRDVALTLAVMPPQYYEQPYLSEQTVGFLPEQAPMISARAKTAAPMAMMESAGAVAFDAVTAGVEVVATGSDFMVKLPQSHSVNSGRDAYVLNYYHEQTAVDMYSAFYSWTWPKNALLMAKWTQPGELPLLVGDSKLYRDGLFLTEVYTGELVRPQSKRERSFGEDTRLEAKVIAPPEYRENNGLIIRDRVLEKQETLAVDNLSTETVALRIYARLPVSMEEKIDVKASWKPKPDAENVENVRGLALWSYELKGGEQVAVEHGYSIRYPEKQTIIGVP